MTGRFLPPVSPKLASRSRLASGHAALVVASAAWMFGGKIWWSKPILCLLVTPAIVLTVWEFLARRTRTSAGAFAPFVWLLPMGALTGLIVLGAAIPNLVQRSFGVETLWFPRAMSAWWPSSADGHKALDELWLLAGCYLTGFNLFVCVRSRRALRALFLFLASNALALAVFGTLQKLTGQDIFFGLQHSPNASFFSTFVYHNHWGAFTVLTISVCLGLVFHYTHRSRARNVWHSPATLGALATFFIAATVPLSSSRSSTLLVGGLLGIALAHGTVVLVRRARRDGRSASAPVLAVFLVFAIACGAAYALGERTIRDRLATTRLQIAEMEARGDIGQRKTLYADTLHMSADKRWFGWGLESYERIFPLYNSTPRSPVDGLPIYYQEAHSDWLQALAEIGVVGTLLLVASVYWPLVAQRGRIPGHPTAVYPLLGCAGVALYACVEFPLANPAVVAAWWVTFFAALRYASLSENR